MRKHLDDYDVQGWLAFYAANPNVRRSIGAAGNDGDGEGDGDAGGESGGDSGGLMGLDTTDDTGNDAGKMPERGRHPADQAAEAPEQEQQDGDKPARPDTVPEQFWDAEKGEVRTDKLGKAYADLRTQFNKLQQDKGKVEVPEDEADYLDGFEVERERGEGDEKSAIKNIREFGNDDPALTSAAAAAKKAGLSKDQFASFVNEFLHGVDDIVPAPLDVDAELNALGGKEKAMPLIRANKQFIDRMAKNGEFNEEEAAFAQQFASSATGLRVLNKLRSMTGEKPIPAEAATSSDGAKTEGEIQQMMADPRYKQDGPVGEEYRATVRGEIEKMNAYRRG